MRKNKVAIVVPVHVQPTKEWVSSLQLVSKNARVIIVDDSDGKVELPAEWDIWGYDRQREALGDDMYERFKVFHKSSACRNFGHWVAYQQDFDVIIALDSDCNVPPDFVSKHLEALEMKGNGWTNPIARTNWFPRGYPYRERDLRVVANVGLWENELDVNGADRLTHGKPPADPMVDIQRIAHGPIPFCGMNTAFRAEIVPALLFLPNWDFYGKKFVRHDDIWGGYILQRLMNYRKDKVAYGFPVVWHDTIVDAQADADQEVAMTEFEESFYTMIDRCTSFDLPNDLRDITYRRLFDLFVDKYKHYTCTNLKNLMYPSFLFWSDLFKAD